MAKYKPLLKCLLVILLVRNSTALNRGLSDGIHIFKNNFQRNYTDIIHLHAELRFLHREIGLLRDENQSQNSEISMLKEIVVGFRNYETIPDHVESHDNNNILKELPTGFRQSSGKSLLSKRPARLLPLRILLGERKNDTNNQISRFYGPPTNCSDLIKLGYTLNGFYLVKTNNTDNTKDVHNLKTETVFCSFKQPEGTYKPTAMEKRLTSPIAVKPDAITTYKKSGGVHFFLKLILKDLVITERNATITFTDVVLNLGGGSLNENLSTFTVPKNGFYQINFSMMLKSSANTSGKQDDDNITIIYICVNTSYPCNYYIKVVGNMLLNRVLIATLKLNRGDKIYTKIKPPLKGHFGLQNFATFSGSLLEEF